MGKVKGVAETEGLNVPILISTSVAGKNVPRSPGPFIKVMKSRVAHYESDSPVLCALHRDTHGHTLSPQLIRAMPRGGFPWESLKAPGERRGESRRGLSRPSCAELD